jgi:hypothetical protein
MALAGFVVVLVVLILVVAVVTAVGGTRSAKAGDTGTATVEGPTVEYLVPDGQDPVAVISHLRQAGYAAHPSEPSVQPAVVVVCPPEGRDELRRTIATAPVSVVDDPSGRGVHRTPSQVRFTDE